MVILSSLIGQVFWVRFLQSVIIVIAKGENQYLESEKDVMCEAD